MIFDGFRTFFLASHWLLQALVMGKSGDSDLMKVFSLQKKMGILGHQVMLSVP